METYIRNNRADRVKITEHIRDRKLNLADIEALLEEPQIRHG